MISDRTLDIAVDQGIVSAAQADGLRALEAAASAQLEEDSADDEKLRFIGGFGDVFVVLGIALVLGSSAYFTWSASGAASMWFMTAALAWLLAEYFTLRRRMALPSIVLALTFVAAGFALLLFVFATALPDGRPAWRTAAEPGLFPERSAWTIALGALTAAWVAGLHYWRFKVPITVAAGAAALASAVIAIAFAVAPDLDRHLSSALVMACGIAIFATAMRFDMADPAWVTRKTDIAFWLHLLAAPLIVQPLIFGFLGGVQDLDAARALGIIAIFLGLGLVAVVIDRRAFLVSGLSYVGLAFGALIHRSGIERETTPATLLALGVFVLGLSAGWRPLRHAALRLLPERLVRRLPHPLTSMPL